MNTIIIIVILLLFLLLLLLLLTAFTFYNTPLKTKPTIWKYCWKGFIWMVTPFYFAHSPLKTTLWVFITTWLKPWKGKDWMLLFVLVLRYCWESHPIQLSNQHLSIPNALKGLPPAKWCWQLRVEFFCSVKENHLRSSTVICCSSALGLYVL